MVTDRTATSVVWSTVLVCEVRRRGRKWATEEVGVNATWATVRFLYQSVRGLHRSSAPRVRVPESRRPRSDGELLVSRSRARREYFDR